MRRDSVPATEPLPRALLAAAAYFTVGGLLEIFLGIWDLPRPLAFWGIWDAVGRGLLHFGLAAMLVERIPLARWVALVYCLATLILHAVVLALAFARAPGVAFPPSVVVRSLYDLPSCALLLPWLRSETAALAFRRPQRRP